MSPSIVFYISNLQSGGTEWSALRLARSMKRLGLRPSFLVSHKEGPLLAAIEKEFEVYALNGSGYSLWGIFKTLPAYLRFLSAHDVAALITGLPLLNMLTGLALFLSRRRPRWIAVEHMRLDTAQPFWTAFGFRQNVKNRLAILAYRLADTVVAVSHISRDDLVRAGLDGSQIRVIPNPVIPDNFEELLVSEPPHPWLRDKRGTVYVGVGRLLHVKAFDVLLKAFAKVAAQRDARLIIFGEGTERPRLESLVQTLGLTDRVALPGTTDNVFAAVKAADVFVLSSRSESFGIVLVEALASGARIVSTDCGGPREVLNAGALGTLVPPEDADALAQAMRDAPNAPFDPAPGYARSREFLADESARLYAALAMGTAARA